MSTAQSLVTIRVLLVDDHPLVRDGVRMRLEATPHIRVAAEAGSMQEAMALAGTVAPDLVLTDIRMPDGSGIQLAAAFRERFPQVRVVVLSMHQDAEYVQRAVGLGVRGYVLKDAPAGQLVQAIEAVHAGGSHFSDAVRALLDAGPPVQPSARSLTPREAAVLRLLAEGRSNRDIAERMGTSVRTVETHRLHLRRKLRIDGQAALVKYAVAYADIRCDPAPGH